MNKISWTEDPHNDDLRLFSIGLWSSEDDDAFLRVVAANSLERQMEDGEDLREMLGNRGLRRNCGTFSSLDVDCVLKSAGRRNKDDGKAAPDTTSSSNLNFFRNRHGGVNRESVDGHSGVMVSCKAFIFKEEKIW